MRLIKAVRQNYRPSQEILKLLDGFRQMVNDCLRVGLKFEEENHATPSMKRLSMLCYGQLKRYNVYSAYRLTAISRAAGILSARRKSIKRGYHTRTPYATTPFLVSCYGVKIEDCCLLVHLGSNMFNSIPLNRHTLKILSQQSLKVRSFTLTERCLSLCIAKEAKKWKWLNLPIQSVWTGT